MFIVGDEAPMWLEATIRHFRFFLAGDYCRCKIYFASIKIPSSTSREEADSSVLECTDQISTFKCMPVAGHVTERISGIYPNVNGGGGGGVNLCPGFKKKKIKNFLKKKKKKQQIRKNTKKKKKILCFCGFFF